MKNKLTLLLFLASVTCAISGELLIIKQRDLIRAQDKLITTQIIHIGKQKDILNECINILDASESAVPQTPKEPIIDSPIYQL